MFRADVGRRGSAQGEKPRERVFAVYGVVVFIYLGSVTLYFTLFYILLTIPKISILGIVVFSFLLHPIHILYIDL